MKRRNFLKLFTLPYLIKLKKVISPSTYQYKYTFLKLEQPIGIALQDIKKDEYGWIRLL